MPDYQKPEVFEMREGTKKFQRLRLAFIGPSGAGKTGTLMRVARGIVEYMMEAKLLADENLRRKLGIVDTEHDSASLYENKMFPDGTRVMPFTTIELNKPYTTDRYKSAVMTFVNAGFPIVGIDQISHAWAGSGGLLEKKDQIAKRENMNSYTAFGEITPEQNEFIEFLLELPCHLIVTMRAKQKHVMETYQKNGENKTRVKRIGMGAVQREDVEYDFTTVINLDIDGNRGTVEKDRTGVFGEPRTDIGRLTEVHGRELAKWLYTGEATANEKIAATTAQQLDAIADTWVSTLAKSSTMPDLAADFGRAWTEIGEFDIGEYARVQARTKIMAAKDSRKVELAPASSLKPGVQTIGPDEVIELESKAKLLPNALADLLLAFSIPRVSNLPVEKLFDARTWLDEQEVLRGTSPAPAKRAAQC